MIDTSSLLTNITSPAKYTEKTATTYSSVDAAQKASSAMDMKSFLKLMVAQLSSQDPTNPVSDTDYSAQLAQYSSLDEMEKMNTNLATQNQLQTMSSGAALIGKTVSGYSNTSKAPVTGVVQGLVVVDSIPYLKVGSNYLAMSEVATVATA